MTRTIVKMTIAVPEEFRNETKIHAINNSQKLKDYVMEAVKMRMKQDESPLTARARRALKESIEEEKEGTLQTHKSVQDLIDNI